MDMSVSHQNLFAEFPPISKADWLNKIEKDLKGRPLSELDWQLPPLSIAPFLHAEDFAEMPEPILDNRSANSWLVGEDIEVTDFKAANKQGLAALVAGVNAPRFVFDDYPTKEQLSVLLADIELDFIVTCFKEKTENRSPLAFLKNVKEIAGAKILDIKGTIHYDPFADGRYDVKAASDVISWASENLPNFTVITVNAERFRTNTDLSREHREGVVSELANALSAGEKYLNKLTVNGLSANLVQKSMAFRFQVGDAYFVEIAKLRAFKLLWGNVLSAYNIAPSTPRLLVYTVDIGNPDSFGKGGAPNENPHTHKIKATTQAMAAVMAGVETLTVSPSEDSDFGRRIARNVQHLLSMESYLDRVADPSAGSYYIERLTEQLAEAAWETFQKQ